MKPPKIRSSTVPIGRSVPMSFEPPHAPSWKSRIPKRGIKQIVVNAQSSGPGGGPGPAGSPALSGPGRRAGGLAVRGGLAPVAAHGHRAPAPAPGRRVIQEPATAARPGADPQPLPHARPEQVRRVGGDQRERPAGRAGSRRGQQRQAVRHAQDRPARLGRDPFIDAPDGLVGHTAGRHDGGDRGIDGLAQGPRPGEGLVVHAAPGHGIPATVSPATIIRPQCPRPRSARPPAPTRPATRRGRRAPEVLGRAVPPAGLPVPAGVHEVEARRPPYQTQRRPGNVMSS